MKVVSWNIENAAPRLAALRTVMEALGEPDVLCLQELRVRAHDPDAVLAPRVRSADILERLPWSDHAPLRVEL